MLRKISSPKGFLALLLLCGAVYVLRAMIMMNGAETTVRTATRWESNSVIAAIGKAISCGENMSYQNCSSRCNITQLPSPDTAATERPQPPSPDTAATERPQPPSPDTAAAERPQLLVVVFSKPTSFSMRNASRNTWMSPYRHNKDIEFKFIVGLGGVEPKLQQEITEETKLYEDMVLFYNHTEGYGLNCTEKILHTLQWASKHSQALYLMKTDDDCYIRLQCISKLLQELSQLYKNKPFICGTIGQHKTPFKGGKWAETRWTLTSEYLPFPYGSGYILPLDLVKAIVKSHPLPLRQLTNEDTSIGLWIAPYNIDYINIHRYHSEQAKYRICPEPQQISEISVFHYRQSPEIMLAAHKCIPQQPCATKHERLIMSLS